MTNYLVPFKRAKEHLGTLGITTEFRRGRPVTSTMLSTAAKRLGRPIPRSLATFYRQVGNGMSFSWQAGKPIPPTKKQLKAWSKLSVLLGADLPMPPEYDEAAFASFDIPPLGTVVKESVAHHRYPEMTHFPHVKNERLARRTYAKMEWWIGIHDEGNGDRICIDTADAGEPIVFDQHDWFDGGTGANGTRMAANLQAFLDGWSSVCFQHPRSLWWPKVLSRRGVSWRNKKEFERRFWID